METRSESGQRSEAPVVVVIGASAGGVDALIQVLSALPADLKASVLIVQHLALGPEPPHLPAILNRNSPLEVRLAHRGEVLRAGQVHIAEPGKHLVLRNGRIDFENSAPVNHVRPAADVLFSSAALAFGPSVVGVVLTGNGRDGAAGCIEIKKRGGLVIAQDLATSLFEEMPRAAQATGVVDHVLALDRIAAKIVEIVNAAGRDKAIPSKIGVNEKSRR